MTTEPALVASLRERIEAALEGCLPTTSALSQRLVQAMRYAVLGGGKRIRSLLTCAVCESLTGDAAPALAPACAIELIHAYSLVHDDLPAMDDDALRRGQPTCHVAFDEATAILAADALQALAFETLAVAPGIGDGEKLKMIQVLAQAAGWRGMVGGQALDMAMTGAPADLARLEQMHQGKTGALVQAAVQLGALAAGAAPARYAALTRFGQRIGLAFQVVDDILDVTANTGTLGKTAGADAVRGKSTYPALLGLARSREFAEQLLAEALRDLAEAGASGTVRELALTIVRRAS